MGYGKLTRAQGAIISAYTGITAGNFGDMQTYAENLLGRPIFTHEFAFKEVWDELREAARADFISICAD